MTTEVPNVTGRTRQSLVVPSSRLPVIPQA